MVRYIFVAVCLFNFGIVSGQGNNYLQNIDHIPLAVFNWEGYKNYGYNNLAEMGADILIVDRLSGGVYNRIKTTAPNLKLMPYTVLELDQNNYIAKYSEGMYGEWNVVGDTEGGKYQFWNDTSKVDQIGNLIKTKTDSTKGTILCGPGEWYNGSFYHGYPQQVKFLIAPKDTINYNSSINLRLETNPNNSIDSLLNTPNYNPPVCTLIVGYWKFVKDRAPNDSTDTFFPKINRILYLNDFQDNQWKEFSFVGTYTWQNTPLTEVRTFCKGTESREIQPRMEFQLIWSGYKYKTLSARNLILYDVDRGKPLMTTPIFNSLIEDLTQNYYNGNQIFSDDNYDNRVISWYAVDEPGSFENFACMNRIDSLMNLESNGKRRLYYTYAGIFNGRVGRNIDVHKEQLRRTGNIIYPTLQNYIVEHPYQSQEPDNQYIPYRELSYCNWANIEHFRVNLKQYSEYDRDNNYTRPFGLMLQTGKWRPYLIGIPTKEQFLYTVNFGLIFGAKLLALNNYFYGVDVANQTSLYNTANQEYSLLWHTIKDTLSKRLKGLMGKTLKNLNATYQKTGINAQDDLSENINTEKLNYIHIIPTEQDPPNAMDITIADVGIYRHKEITETKDYFIIVNRHYSTYDNFSIGLKDLNNYKNWTLVNLTDTISRTLISGADNASSFTEIVGKGDGKLYGLAPTINYGGEITENEVILTQTTLEGNLVIGSGKTLTVNSIYNIYGDITIRDGAKLCTQGNGELRINSGKRITVEGSGEISGTTASKLKIHFASPVTNSEIYAKEGTHLTVSNCRIENADKGVYYKNDGTSEEETGGSLSVSNCEFVECYTGIKIESLSSTIPYISNNKFTDCGFGVFSQDNAEVRIAENEINSLFGVWMENTGNGIIDKNTFTPANENNGVGIYLNSSYGWLGDNTISGFYNGIFLGSSSPIIRENMITNHFSNGIYSGFSSSPNISTSSIGEGVYLIGGYNGIENSGTDKYNIAEIYVNNGNPNLNMGYNCIIDDRDLSINLIDGEFERKPPTIQAQGNYWGNDGLAPSGRFGIDVDYRDFLDICINISGGGGATESLILRDNANRVIDTVYSVGTTGNTLCGAELLEAEAEEEYVAKEYTEATTKYLSVVNEYGTERTSLKSYQRLYEIDKLTKAANETISSRISLFQGKGNQTSDTLLNKTINHLVSLYYVEKEEYQTAIGRYEEIIANSSNEEEVLFAEIDALTTAYLSSQSSGGLHKVSGGKYLVKPNEDYLDRATELLSKKFSAFKTKESDQEMPKSYGLSQNYPNPFNPVTTIKYQLPVNSKVTLTIYDILGKEVSRLVNEEQEAGNYEVKFNGGRLASGVYICRIIAGDFVKTIKMSLVK